MIVITALMLLMKNAEVDFLCVLIVVLREIIISSIRLIALEKNIVIAASILGKYKTASQMIAIIMLLLRLYIINEPLYFVTYILFYVSTALVILSLADYVIKSKDILSA